MKFLEQLVLVMDALEDSGCYDPDDGFFYDLLTDALREQGAGQGTDPGGGDSRPACHDAANSKYRTSPTLAKAVCSQDGSGESEDSGLADPRNRK